MARGIFRCSTRALRYGAWAPEHMGSVVAAHGLSSCGAQAQWLRHAGLVGFLTTGPPGKSHPSNILSGTILEEAGSDLQDEFNRVLIHTRS